MYIYIYILTYCYLAFHKLFCISDIIVLRYMLDHRTFQNEVKSYFTDLLHFQSIYEACGESLNCRVEFLRTGSVQMANRFGSGET